MFTVIIISKRASDLLREYRFLFKPFVDNETIAFCDWNESGTDVASSVPDLYNIVKGKKQWRALILNTDSVYDYRGAAHPGKQNPFDYTEADPETMPHESPIPVIRLTHIIGGYSTTPVKNFEKGFEFVDEETGEKRRVREADLTEEEVHALSLQYGDMVTDIYMEKEEPEELYLRQQALSEKYAFSDIRPSEILLVATRKKTEGSEKARIIESWRNRLEMSSSCFWERNKYPNNCRFLFYDITNSDNSLYTKELTEFWLSVLTLAINKIPASTLQAYRLYRIGVDVSRDKLETGLNLHLNKLDSAYGFIKEQLRLKPEYSFDEDEELVHRQVVPVAIEKSEGRDEAELLPVDVLRGLLSLLRDGVEARVEERGHDENCNDAAHEARSGRGGTTRSVRHLGEHGHGVARGTGHEADDHGEDHAGQERLGEEAGELSSGASALEVHEDDEHGEAKSDDRRPEVHVSAENRVELNAREPRKNLELSEAGGQKLRDGDGLPGAEGRVAEKKHPAGDEAHLAAVRTLDVLDDAAGNRNSRGKLAEDHSDGHEKDGAESEGDHCGDRTAAEHHPIAHEKHPSGADDCAKADGEEVEER